MNQPTSFIDSLAAALGHATPILSRVRNVFGQRRLPAEAATAHDAHEPRHEMSLLERNSLVLEITGMTCAGCAGHVEKALQKVEGVEKTEVNYDKKEAVVTYDDAKTGVEALTKATDVAGYPSEVKQ